MSGELLAARGVTVAYSGVRANDAIDLTIAQGESIGLIGANGSGKSTFIDALTGFVPVTSGSIRFAGRDIRAEAPEVRARQGLVRTFQAIELFDDLTIADNLLVAMERTRLRSVALDLIRSGRSPAARDQVRWALSVVGLEGLEARLPRDLSNGQRKLAGVARALVARPKLALLDEPAAGLDAAESVELGKLLRTLPDQGIAVLLIEHDMGLVLSVCDRIYVLDFGRVIAQGTSTEIRNDPAVIAAYLGGSDQGAPPPTASGARGGAA
jgi:branched-chain amino acid transport system ATP-binding protein